MKTFDDKEIENKLSTLTGWNLIDEAIEKRFVFKNFNRALGFIVQIGLLAEQANHHPEIFNVYNKVTIRLNTHEAKGITDKDFDLAEKINEIV